jgi:hypothetical protein
LKILSLKNAIKALQQCYFRFGGQKPLKLTGFLLLKKKFFAYFASKLKILSLKNAIKALYFWFGGEKSCKFQTFFQKAWFLSIFGPHFRFLWQNFATFCHKAREALKILKN